MRELVNEFLMGASIDSFGELLMRDLVNSWTRTPFNLYADTFRRTVANFGLDNSHVILDVGCGTGEAIETGLRLYNQQEQTLNKSHKPLDPRIIGVDPILEPLSSYKPSSNFTLYQDYGEYTRLKDNSVDVTFLERVIYRAFDPNLMIQEAIRVTKPEGLIVVTSNGMGHAPKRYGHEEDANVHAFRKIHWPVQEFKPPAHNLYGEQLPDFVSRIGRLVLVENNIKECIAQDEPIFVTEERLPYYLDAIAMSEKRAQFPTTRAYPHWRWYTYNRVAAAVRADMSPDEYGNMSYEDRVVRITASFRNMKLK